MFSAASDPTNVSPIPVTVDFGEAVTGFDVADLTVGNGAAGNLVDIGGGQFTFDVTPAADGLVTVDIAAGVCADLAGNLNSAAPQFSRTYDGTAPGVSLSSTAPNPAHPMATPPHPRRIAWVRESATRMPTVLPVA